MAKKPKRKGQNPEQNDQNQKNQNRESPDPNPKPIPEGKRENSGRVGAIERINPRGADQKETPEKNPIERGNQGKNLGSFHKYTGKADDKGTKDENRHRVFIKRVN